MRYAPLAFALLIANAPPQEATQINVTLQNFKFTPSTIQLKPNKPYILHLSSTGAHSFEAAAFFAAAKVAPADRIKVAHGRVEIEDGKSVDIHLVAPGPGRFPLRCSHLLHASFGMTGTIVVG
jgi:uncharacterized cupredoxin-like copper-binding protein